MKKIAPVTLAMLAIIGFLAWKLNAKPAFKFGGGGGFGPKNGGGGAGGSF